MIQFRLLNVPVTIHPSFFLFFLFLTDLHQVVSIEGVMVGVILVVSLLIHEYGHALTAMHYGARPEINLEAFGGNAQYNNCRMTPKQEFIITINGPLLESVLIVIPYFLLNIGFSENTYVNYFLYKMMRLNILWCLFNLIPVSPLDGGHILKFLLEKKFANQSTRISLVIGIAAALLGSIYFLLNSFYYFGGLLLILGFKSFQQYQHSRFSTDSNPFSLYNRGLRHFEDNELDKAKIIFKRLMKSKDKRIKAWSTESFAIILHKENKNKEAYKNLLQIEHQYLTKGKNLLCKLAFEEGNYSLIKTYSREIYTIDPSYEVALLNSKAYACLNDSNSSGGWLRTASLFENSKESELANILQLNIYNQVRDNEDFKKHLPGNCS